MSDIPRTINLIELALRRVSASGRISQQTAAFAVQFANELAAVAAQKEKEENDAVH